MHLCVPVLASFRLCVVSRCNVNLLHGASDAQVYL